MYSLHRGTHASSRSQVIVFGSKYVDKIYYESESTRKNLYNESSTISSNAIQNSFIVFDPIKKIKLKLIKNIKISICNNFFY